MGAAESSPSGSELPSGSEVLTNPTRAQRPVNATRRRQLPFLKNKGPTRTNLTALQFPRALMDFFLDNATSIVVNTPPSHAHMALMAGVPLSSSRFKMASQLARSCVGGTFVFAEGLVSGTGPNSHIHCPAAFVLDTDTMSVLDPFIDTLQDEGYPLHGPLVYTAVLIVPTHGGGDKSASKLWSGTMKPPDKSV